MTVGDHMGTGYYVSDSFIVHRIGTELKFVWFPTICHISGRVMFLELAYVQTAMWTGPGEPVFESRWYDKHEYVKAQLKGEV